MKKSLIKALNEALSDKGGMILSNSILGLSNADEIAKEINDFCKVNLASAVSSCLYAGFSVGASFGIELQDGRKIFIKVHKPSNKETLTAISKEFLTSVSTVQSYLSKNGFPCPEVLIKPSELGNGIATVDVFAKPGEQKDAHNPVIRQAIAQKLAELIQRTEPYKKIQGLTHGKFFGSKTLYPIPHNALFNFEKNSRGAEWIDTIAKQAKKIIDNVNGNIVLGHVDWSLKHFRFVDNQVAMIYDWDSLKLEDELHVLGIAAATYTTTWDIPVKITPSQEEAYQFVREYEGFRGKKFSSEEIKKISATITYCMAYIARCEHNPNNENHIGAFQQALDTMIGKTYLNV